MKSKIKISGIAILIIIILFVASYQYLRSNSISKQSLSMKPDITSDDPMKTHKPSSRRKKTRERSFNNYQESSLDYYQVIAENNLFRPIDWRKEVVKKRAPNPKPEPLPVKPPRRRPPPEPTYNLTLTGIVQNGAEWMAILEDETRGEGVFRGQGEKLKDALISEIFSEHIFIVRADAKVQLALGESIAYNTNGQILFDAIANQKPVRRSGILSANEGTFSVNLSEPSRAFLNEQKVETGDDAQQSLIERMRARRQREFGK